MAALHMLSYKLQDLQFFNKLETPGQIQLENSFSFSVNYNKDNTRCMAKLYQCVKDKTDSPDHRFFVSVEILGVFEVAGPLTDEDKQDFHVACYHVEARHLKLVVHICRQHKVVLALHQGQQSIINRPGGVLVAVHHNMPAPPCPILLQRRERVKSPGIHVLDAVFFFEVSEVFLKPLPGVGQSRRSGQPRPRADHHSVGAVKRLPQSFRLCRGDGGRAPRQAP